MHRGLKKYILLSIFFVITLFGAKEVYAADDFCLFSVADKYYVTLSFDTDGAKEIQNLNFCGAENCGIEKFKLPTQKKKGYVFKGWYADSNFETKLNDEFVKKDDQNKLALLPVKAGCNVKHLKATIYAKFEEEGNESCPEESYSNIVIKYETNGGNKIEDRYVCESCEDVMMSLSIPEKEGYYFLGWFSDKDFLNPMPGNMVYSSELVANLDLYVADSDDECNNDRVGKVYARWATEEEFNFYVSDYVEKELEYISLLTSK